MLVVHIISIRRLKCKPNVYLPSLDLVQRESQWFYG